MIPNREENLGRRIWSAEHASVLMRTLFRLMRVLIFKNPTGMGEDSAGFELSEKDKQFFTHEFDHEFAAGTIEALRQDARGMTRDFTIERLLWPFELENIHAPTVLVFHGADDRAVHPEVGEYVGTRIPTCSGTTIYPGEGHSVIYYRYQEIVRAMLEAWE